FIAASAHCSSVIPDFAVPRRDWQRVRDRRFGSALMSLSSGAQHLDTRQGLALEPFEEGAAGGRDIGEALGHAGAVERCHRVAAAGDRDKLSSGGPFPPPPP